MRHFTFFFAVVFLPLALHAQQSFAPGAAKPTLKAFPAQQPIEVDGMLQESDWQRVEAATSFTQIEPNQGTPSEVRTEVRLLYNDKSIIVGVVCYEPKGQSGSRAPDLKRDFSWRAHDTFAMCFDGFNDERNSIAFAINPYEAQKDYLSFDDTFFDGDWNGLWKVRTTRTDTAWIAEVEIPWKTLRYPSQVSGPRTWGVNFLRLRRNSNEISTWAPYPRSFGFNRMEYAGKIEDLTVPAPSANVQLNPYALAAYEKQTPGAEGATQQIKAGGELKWAVNANNVLDVTVNTDFAQADADVRVNNLSRFSVFFPERRSFFLENASLFGSGLIPNDRMGGRMVFLPFFSRTIGLSNGNPLSIDGGVRWVHRSLNENFGVMTMRQRAQEAEPVTYFGVARYSRNIGKQNRIGGLLTAKHQQADGTNQMNQVAGVDGFFRFGEAHSLNGMILRSQTTASKSGWGGYAQYLYTTNSIQAWWTQTVATNGFNPEMGFVSRQDVVATTPGLFTNLRGSWLPWKKILRAYKPGITAEWYHAASTGRWMEKEIKAYPFWVDFQSGAFVGYSISEVFQQLDQPFEPLGMVIKPGTYQYERHVLFAGTDASRKISGSVQQEWGSYFDGSLSSTDVNVTLAPLPHISLRWGVNTNYFSELGERGTNKTVTLYTSEFRLAWNPRLQLIGLHQYNSQYRLSAYNVRLQWEYSPLSYIFVVFNNRSFDDLRGRVQEQAGIFKLSYLHQF